MAGGTGPQTCRSFGRAAAEGAARPPVHELDADQKTAKGEVILLSREEWQRFLQLCLEDFKKTAAIAELRAVVGRKEEWGPWIGSFAEEKMLEFILRGRSDLESRWPSELRALRDSYIRKVFSDLRPTAVLPKNLQKSIAVNFSCHSSPVELASALSMLDLVMFEGNCDDISLERLELSWVLQCYPSQVEELLKDEALRGCLKSLTALRREACRLIEAGPKRLESPTARALRPFVTFGESSEDQEERLMRIGLRATELLALQDVIRDSTRRLWKQKDAERIAIHKALIIVGACSPELILQELAMETGAGAKAAGSPPQSRLNLCLVNLCCPEILDQASVVLRAKARENADKAVLEQHSLAPLLVTAPHNIVLIRDGKPPHRMEECTTQIAQTIAEFLGGASLTWSRREQYRTELRWSLVKCHGLTMLPGNGSGFLDESNRDPNFLSEDEVLGNEWFEKMLVASNRCRAHGASLHLDVHGCRDPPHHPAHLIIGLGALRQGASSPEELAAVAAFGEQLSKSVAPVIEGLKLVPEAAPVRVLVPADPEEPPSLSGAWQPSCGRLTQTQQALRFARFTHAVQLEMSLSLRRALVRDKDSLSKFASSLWNAWTQHIRRSGL